MHRLWGRRPGRRELNVALRKFAVEPVITVELDIPDELTQDEAEEIAWELAYDVLLDARSANGGRVDGATWHFEFPESIVREVKE